MDQDIEFGASDIEQPTAQASQPGEVEFGDSDVQAEPKPESTFSKVERVANTPHPTIAAGLGFAPAIASSGLDDATKRADAQASVEIAHGNPFRAGLATFLAGAGRDVKNLSDAMTSPVGALTTIAGPESKAISGLASLYFAWRGAQSALTDALPNEAPADTLERRLMGAGTVAFSAAGGAATAKDTVHTMIRNNLGITGKLADTVESSIQKADAIRAQAGADRTAVSQMGSGLQDVNAQAQARNPMQVTKTIKGVLADAAYSVEQEHARVTKPFIEMATDHTDPVSTATDVKAIISNAAHDFGVQDSEIPASAYKAIGKRGQMESTGMSIDEAGGPSPLMKVTDTSTNDLNFYDMTRIKDDLFESARSAKDGAVKASLNSAANHLDDMQADFAAKNGFAGKYAAAKNQYMLFKRELGSNLMSDWISARDVQEQAIAPKLAQLTSPSNGEALRTILSKAGVDVRPLDQLMSEGKSLEGQPKLLAKGQTTALKSIGTGMKADLGTFGKEDQVVPGTSNFELGGRGESEISKLRMAQQLKNMKTAGVTNPMGLVMITYGLIKMASGSMFGLFPAAYGAAKIGVPEVVLNPAFQDWVVRESGIEPSNRLMVFKTKQGIANLYPFLRKATQSGIPAAATGAAPTPRERKQRRAQPSQ